MFKWILKRQIEVRKELAEAFKRTDPNDTEKREDLLRDIQTNTVLIQNMRADKGHYVHSSGTFKVGDKVYHPKHSYPFTIKLIIAIPNKIRTVYRLNLYSEHYGDILGALQEEFSYTQTQPTKG